MARIRVAQQRGTAPPKGTKMTKTTAISQMILAKVAEGLTVVEAMRAVCGNAVVEAMISDLYQKLRGE